MMFENVDWSRRADHMWRGHGVTVDEADEALADEAQVVFAPDYASQSGIGIRVIGYSPSAAAVLTVIVVPYRGRFVGSNAWRSNLKDQRIYLEEQR